MMGTNYYMVGDVCNACGHEKGRIHIGKSSAGWCFSLHVHPEIGIYSWHDWQLKLLHGMIENEYGERISLEQMIAVVELRFWERKGTDPNWFATNDAEPGPNGLARHRIDGTHCIGHGEGTWDHIIGDFS